MTTAHFQRLSVPPNVGFVLHNVKRDQTAFVTKSLKGAGLRKLLYQNIAWKVAYKTLPAQ